MNLYARLYPEGWHDAADKMDAILTPAGQSMAHLSGPAKPN